MDLDFPGKQGHSSGTRSSCGRQRVSEKGVTVVAWLRIFPAALRPSDGRLKRPFCTMATSPVKGRGGEGKENERATGGAVQEIVQDTTFGGGWVTNRHGVGHTFVNRLDTGWGA